MTRYERTRSWRTGRRKAVKFGIGCGVIMLAALAGCNGRSPVPGAAKARESGKERTALELSARVVELSGLKTEVARRPTRPRTLQLRGSLALDVNRLVHVHARFPGQIFRIEMVEDQQGASVAGPHIKRQLNFMDHVMKGQKLAQIWSKELGEKKSELVDSLVRLRIDEQNLKFLQDLLRKGATTEKAVREGQRQVEVGEIAVAKAERTLRSWSLQDEEIEAVKADAERIHKGGSRENQQDERWASVDVISPIDGTIVEKNVVEGDLVNADSNLFKIADLSVLSAWARIYEEDIPLLQSLPKPISWTLRLSASPQIGPITGTIDRIGEIIDPNEHMALMVGLVKNPSDQLHVGQNITAIIELPPEADVLEIPTRALVEDGDESVIFVQADPGATRYTMRRVSVVRRHYDRVYVRSALTSEQKREGLEELHEGERVVAAGALELKAALQVENGQ